MKKRLAYLLLFVMLFNMCGIGEGLVTDTEDTPEETIVITDAGDNAPHAPVAAADYPSDYMYVGKDTRVFEDEACTRLLGTVKAGDAVYAVGCSADGNVLTLVFRPFGADAPITVYAESDTLLMFSEYDLETLMYGLEHDATVSVQNNVRIPFCAFIPKNGPETNESTDAENNVPDGDDISDDPSATQEPVTDDSAETAGDPAAQTSVTDGSAETAGDPATMQDLVTDGSAETAGDPATMQDPVTDGSAETAGDPTAAQTSVTDDSAETAGDPAAQTSVTDDSAETAGDPAAAQDPAAALTVAAANTADSFEDMTAQSPSEAVEIPVSLDAVPALGIGEYRTLTLRGVAADETVVWRTSAKKIVSIDQTGRIKGVATGTATISATLSDGSVYSVGVKVKYAPTSVSVKSTLKTLGVGETAALTVTYSSGAGGSRTVTSSNTDVLIVREDGLLEGVSPGTATVRVKAYNGKYADIKLTVKPAPQELTLSAAEVELSAGDSVTFTALRDEGSAGTITFTSSDPSVVKITSGKLTAVKAGSADITASTYNGITAVCAVTVRPAVTSLTLSYPSTSIGAGEKLSPTLTVNPDGALSQVYTWSTTAKSIVKVNRSGVIQGNALGSATITVRAYNGKSASMKITVKPAPAKVKLSESSVRMCEGLTHKLTASITKNCASRLTWTSSDPEVVTVTDGALTALKPGTAVVTVATFNGKTAACTVEVCPRPTSVTLDTYALSLPCSGASAAIEASLAPAETCATVTYISSDTAVATVDANGTVHAVRKGHAVITAMTGFDGVSAEADVVVEDDLDHDAITLTPDHTPIGIGEVTSMRADGYDWSDALVWKTSNKKVVAVDGTGRVKGVAAGTAVITAVFPDGSAESASVLVGKAPTKVKTACAPTTLGVGETAVLTVSFPKGEAGGYRVTSMNADVVRVREDGRIEGIAPGTAVVRVQTYNKKYADIRFTVKKAPTTLTLSENDILISAGDRTALTVSVDSGSSSVFTYTSADSGIVTVSGDGTLTAVAEGTTFVTVTTYNGLSAVCAVTVRPALTGFTLTYPSAVIGVGESFLPEITARPEGALSRRYSWATSAKSILKISGTGTVKGVAPGTATVTATAYNGRAAKFRLTVRYAPSKVTLSAASVTLCEGRQTALKAKLPANSASMLTWTSSDESVVTVANGTLTAVAPGTARVTVMTFNGKTAACNVMVYPKPAEIALDSESTDFPYAGGRVQLTPAVLPEGCLTPITYESSDPAVAEVDANGLVRAKARGTAVITVHSELDDVFARFTVNVTGDIPIDTVTLTPERMPVGVGEQVPITPIGYAYPDALIWKTSNKKVATVDRSGVLKGIAVGTADITAVFPDGQKLTLHVTVKNAPTKVSMKVTPGVLGVGEKAVMTVGYGKGECGGRTAKSGNSEVVRVCEDGTLEGVAPGTASVKVTSYNKKSVTVNVTVKPAPTELTLSDTAVALSVGDTYTLTAAIDAGAAGTLTWSCDDSALLDISQSGALKALAEGQTTVTVTTYNGISAQCEVDVRPAVTGVTLTDTAVTLGVGEGYRPVCMPAPEDAVIRSVSMTSANTGIAKIKSGKVVGVNPGKTTVTVKTYNGKTATLTVTVKAAPTKVTLSKTDIKLCVGTSETLTAKLPKDTASVITWSGYDESILRVEGGMLTGIAPGTTTVTASTFNGKTAACTVQVFLTPESLTLESDTAEVEYAGGKVQIMPVLSPEGSWTEYTYTSSDTDVATVDASGNIKTKRASTAVITVDTLVEGISAEFTVTVLNDGRLSGLIIGIDPGHQAHANYQNERVAPWTSAVKNKVASGATGCSTHIPEYKTNLRIAFKLRDMLEDLGATVIMTRESHDVDISNIQRATMMNKAGADLVLRLHCNGVSNRSTTGIVIYTPTVSSIKSASYQAGKCVLNAMCAATGAKKHSVNITDVYSGNNWSTVPVMLVEMGYLSNPEEDRLLNSADYQTLLCEGMTNGICTYFNR